MYEGETGRSLSIRVADHLDDFLKKRETSVLLKHKLTDYKNKNVQFKIMNKIKDLLTRQANQAVQKP